MSENLNLLNISLTPLYNKNQPIATLNLFNMLCVIHSIVRVVFFLYNKKKKFKKLDKSVDIRKNIVYSKGTNKKEVGKMYTLKKQREQSVRLRETKNVQKSLSLLMKEGRLSFIFFYILFKIKGGTPSTAHNYIPCIHMVHNLNFYNKVVHNINMGPLSPLLPFTNLVTSAFTPLVHYLHTLPHTAINTYNRIQHNVTNTHHNNT